MGMAESDTGIAGLSVFRLESHRDERGSLTETYRRSWLERGREAVQANVSRSHPGVLRGLHWHANQSDMWCFLTGVAFVAFADLRSGSPSRFGTFSRTIDAERQPYAIAIPPGVAHGFYAETGVVLQYLVDAYYSGEDEFGLAWDDPDLGIPWPNPRPLLSERDRSNPDLATAAELAPAY